MGGSSLVYLHAEAVRFFITHTNKISCETLLLGLKPSPLTSGCVPFQTIATTLLMTVTSILLAYDFAKKQGSFAGDYHCGEPKLKYGGSPSEH